MKAYLKEKIMAVPLFFGIGENEDALEKIVNICELRIVKKHQVIFLEGDPGHEMYIPLTGEVEIFKRSREGDTYTVTKLNSADPVFFGELALVDDEKRSATVVVTQEGECLVISKKDFLEFGNQYPDIALPITRAIAQTLATRLRKTTEDMLALFDALVNEIRD